MQNMHADAKDNYAVVKGIGSTTPVPIHNTALGGIFGNPYTDGGLETP